MYDSSTLRLVREKCECSFGFCLANTEHQHLVVSTPILIDDEHRDPSIVGGLSIVSTIAADSLVLGVTWVHNKEAVPYRWLADNSDNSQTVSVRYLVHVSHTA